MTSLPASSDRTHLPTEPEGTRLPARPSLHGDTRPPAALRTDHDRGGRHHAPREPGPQGAPSACSPARKPRPPDACTSQDSGGDRLLRLVRGAGPPALSRSVLGAVTGPDPVMDPVEVGARAGAGADASATDSAATGTGLPPPNSADQMPVASAPERQPVGPGGTSGSVPPGWPVGAGVSAGERRVIRPTRWAAPAVMPDPPEPERVARAALTRLIEPGDAAVGRAIHRLGAPGLLQGFYDGASPGRLGLGADRIAAYQERLRKFNPATDLERIAKLGGKFIIPGDSEWPSQLDDLGDSRPVGLWVRGRPAARLPSLRLLALRSVAVVGSRACTAYGRHVAGQLGSELAERGWVVVSGAAYGVDTAAHLGALAVNGMTIAVLASGVDICYPRGNESLIKRIGHDGLLISELALGMNPNRFRFVLRNRVIAALTRGTVVVEAAPRSGALSTARRARDLNRHTMGVPGQITSELSEGVHALIRSGTATMVTNGAEVGELIGSIGEDLAPERVGPILPRDALEPAVARVLEAVPASADGAPVQRLAHYAALSQQETVQHLHELSALGFVERHGAHWRLVRRK